MKIESGTENEGGTFPLVDFSCHNSVNDPDFFALALKLLLGEQLEALLSLSLKGGPLVGAYSLDY